MERYAYTVEKVNLDIEIIKSADDQWEKPISFKAHDQGVNCISWGPLYCGNDYFVIKFVSINKLG